MEQGDLVAVPRAGWHIRGTTGGLTNAGPGSGIRLIRHTSAGRRDASLDLKARPTFHYFYQNLTNHLMMGERLVVTAPQARCVIGVLVLAERPHQQSGRPLALPGEQEYEPDYLIPW